MKDICYYACIAFLGGIAVYWGTVLYLGIPKANRLPGGAITFAMMTAYSSRHFGIMAPFTILGALVGHFLMVYLTGIYR